MSKETIKRVAGIPVGFIVIVLIGYLPVVLDSLDECSIMTIGMIITIMSAVGIVVIFVLLRFSQSKTDDNTQKKEMRYE